MIHPADGSEEPGCLHIELAGRDAGLDAEIVADRCWLLGATAIGLVDTQLEVGFASTGDARHAAAALGEWRGDLVVRSVDAGPALAAALEAWKPHARPYRVGGLQVRPAWLAAADDPPAAGERVVVVDPTRAFGYDHPSTIACLEVVAADAGPGCSFLDLGCGSGILAVAAAVLGAAPVVAVDVDAAAVAATRAAARRNGVSIDADTTRVGDLDGRFDLVAANIGAAALIDLAPVLVPRVATGGKLVLAGLLRARAAAVVAAYQRAGLHLAAVGQRDGWASPVLLRKSTTSAR